MIIEASLKIIYFSFFSWNLFPQNTLQTVRVQHEKKLYKNQFGVALNRQWSILENFRGWRVKLGHNTKTGRKQCIFESMKKSMRHLQTQILKDFLVGKFYYSTRGYPTTLCTFWLKTKKIVCGKKIFPVFENSKFEIGCLQGRPRRFEKKSKKLQKIQKKFFSPNLK